MSPPSAILLSAALLLAAGTFSAAREPLVRVIELDVGESQEVTLCDGSIATVKLFDVTDTHDSLSGAVRRSQVTLEVNGERTTLVSATYHLPATVAGVRIDCPITSGYLATSSANRWGLTGKAARLRLWPADGPLLTPDTFRYPVDQRWFATATQMANVPTFVDGGESPRRKSIYYHSGLDIGGAEHLVNVSAATDALVVSVGDEVMTNHRLGAPVSPRYDVVYLLDDRGWYYRYSHLATIDESITLGKRIAMGSPVGTLGKEGGSGGWTHLHFEIKSRQPSGEWGTQEGYAFLWEAYRVEHDPDLLAVARPHHFVAAGEEVTLDATKSWSRSGKMDYTWEFRDGSTATGPRVRRTYDRPGVYSEILRVTDAKESIDHDFAVVQVVDRDDPRRLPPTIHAAYAPSHGIRPGDPVTFKVRTFRTTARGKPGISATEPPRSKSAPMATRSNTPPTATP